ncbi:MAG TPA: hypothetical protein VKF82_10670 [Candidatus Eremiobacteraceae bacterium]|nr:hypothetical protein [Candidatus Eremiobacteraceae bacterium]
MNEQRLCGVFLSAWGIVRLALHSIPKGAAALGCALITCFGLPGSVHAAVSHSAPTRYLVFQLFTYGGPSQAPLPPAPVISETVHDIISAIGTTGGDVDKLGFAVGPLTLDQSDGAIRQLIETSFSVARADNVAVAFHIDDSMFWPRGSALDRSANLEWLDWNGTPNTGRRLDWGPAPTKIAPQLCLNSPAVEAAARARAQFIGAQIKTQLDSLRRDHRERLFAGVIAGWETQIGQDFDTGRYLGYCALTNGGFSSGHQPADPDAEISKVVQGYIELWAQQLARAGIPADKIYSQIAVTAETPAPGESGSISYDKMTHFAPPSVAFGEHYLPGFSTYPEPGTFELIYSEVAAHGNPAWISAEGTNVVPTGMPGEPTMETYLGKMYNHGAVLVNIFSWGIGGKANANNFFRVATENAEAISAYRKFLGGEQLVELPPSKNSFSPLALQQKIREIQQELPSWVQANGPTKVAPLMQQLDGLLKAQQFLAADHVADKILQILQTQ